jgi:hypothetical protein
MFARIAFWFWSLIVSTDRLWAGLESAGIIVFVGPNGFGKSLVMIQGTLGTLAGRPWSCFDVEHRHHQAFAGHAADCTVCDVPKFLAYSPTEPGDVMAALSDGVLCPEGAALIDRGCTGERLVYSTVRLTSDVGVPHPLFRPLTSYQQLLTIEHADVLFDEVAGIADASESASIPVQVTNFLHQLRKRDIRLRVTTPAYKRCALPIRQVAQVVVECRGFFPARSKGDGRLWRPRRVVRAQVFDAWDFEDYTASEGQRERLRTMAKGVVWVPTSPAIKAYNSFGQVLQLGHVNEAGMCTACGGSRPRPKCGCDGSLDGIDPDLIQIETTKTAAGTVVKRAVLREVPQ